MFNFVCEKKMNLRSELLKILSPTQILDKPIELIAYASDASIYRLIPKAVVQPESNKEIQALFELSHRIKIPITFRAAGTSLCGQAVSDGILVDVSRYWNKIEVQENGKSVSVQPGAIGSIVNAYLKNHQAKIGPDPASINACMIGGILANNSSGMCCGVTNNSYHTIESIEFILPNGILLNTASDNADSKLKDQAPELYQGLLEIKKEIISDPKLNLRIREKYKIKNTTGYSLNSFIDFERPVDILAHLLIGSEGTLAFISNAVMKTLPDYPLKYTGLLFFDNIENACSSIQLINDSGASAIELMDRAALRSVEHLKALPHFVKDLPDTASAFLVEYQCSNQDELSLIIAKVEQICNQLPLLKKPDFTSDTDKQADMWTVRKGLFPSVGAVRAKGTTVIIEDIAFSLDKLSSAIKDLQSLFQKHQYYNAIIFGHAKDGNIHFVISQSFNSQDAIKRYDLFMKDMVSLVVEKYDGALKAEHGTGRNIAPFVETEWGESAYNIMKRVKALIDPENLLNPGVIINHDKNSHINDLKSLPEVDDLITKCIECGFCEPQCPSRNLTLTPRQRIVIQRELERLGRSNNHEKRNQLLKDLDYYSFDTCAMDGLCETQCPVSINTAELTLLNRQGNSSYLYRKIASWLSHHFLFLEKILKLSLKFGHSLGHKNMYLLTKTMRRINKNFPLWSHYIPRPAKALPHSKGNNYFAVYFPSCSSRIMSDVASSEKSIAEVFLSLSEKANKLLLLPEDSKGNCCGALFKSNGEVEAYKDSVNQLIEKFWHWSNGGELIIVVDMTYCTQNLLNSLHYLTEENQKKYQFLTIVDHIDFVSKYIISNIKINKKIDRVVLHPNCSAQKLKLTENMRQMALRCANEVHVPIHLGCCGMAGNRGLQFPELTKSATEMEAMEVKQKQYQGYYSNGITCEIGMSQAVEQNYQSILYLVDRVSQ